MSFFSPLIPRWRSFLNSWFLPKHPLSVRVIRFVFLLSIFIILPSLIFKSVFTTLTELTLHSYTVATVIDMILFSVLSVLFFSNAVHALNILFFSKENELLILAPIPLYKLYASKFVEILYSASWVIALFFIPAMAAVGASVGASSSYYLILLLSTPGLLLIPTAIGVISSVLLVRVYPKEYVKEILIICSIVVIILLHFFLTGKQAILNVQNLTPQALIKGKTISVDSISLLVAYPFLVGITGDISKALPVVFSMLSIAVLAIFSGYAVFKELYFSLEPGSSHKQLVRQDVLRGAIRLPSFLSPAFRAIAVKEYKCFLRDMAQPVQLVLFLTLAAVGLVGIQSSAIIARSTIQTTDIWYDFLVVVITTFHLFLIVLFCGRFVYPSASLEGEASWILDSSPRSKRELINARINAYQIPIIIIFSALVLAASFIVSLPPQFIFYSILLCGMNTLITVNFAVSIGTFFAQTDHHNASQILSGFGNFIYMIVSLVLLAIINVIALSFGVIPDIVGLHPAREVGYCFSILILILFTCFSTRTADIAVRY